MDKNLQSEILLQAILKAEKKLITQMNNLIPSFKIDELIKLIKINLNANVILSKLRSMLVYFLAL